MIESLCGKSVQGVPLDNVSVLRLDKLGGRAPGNKVFKLRYNLSLAREQGVRRVLSFGGGWSNHLHALAAVGAELELETIGIVRGGDTPTAMLEDARGWGMRLVPVSRADYRRRDELAYRQHLAARFGAGLVIPEGGANPEGMLGCREIAALAETGGRRWSKVLVAVGTGTTLAGLAAGLQSSGELVGISALKGAGDLEARVAGLLDSTGCKAQLPWHIDHAHHCGGFARVSEPLCRFIAGFERATCIALEPVYTAKVFYALQQKLASGEWRGDESILAIHTGGLQGRRGYAWLASPGGDA